MANKVHFGVPDLGEGAPHGREASRRGYTPLCGTWPDIRITTVPNMVTCAPCKSALRVAGHFQGPREALAALEHDQWAHWTKYMLDTLEPLVVATTTQGRGVAVQAALESIERWRRQIDTPYADLSESEKDSDREWADKVMTLLKEQ